MDKNIILSKRLAAAASYIRKDAIFADIGTDHGLLPIYAIMKAGACRAYASDVNSGPLERAKENISRLCDCSVLPTCVLTSGFDGMETLGLTDAAICGMGGELAAEIILRGKETVSKPDFRLIIQSMTKLDAVRRGLWRAGFDIISETVVFEYGKYYTVICADFCGIDTSGAHDDFEAAFGDFAVKQFEANETRAGYLAHEIAKYERIEKGKALAGLSVSEEETVIKWLSEKTVTNLTEETE